MINLRKISLLLVMLSLAVFAGCAGESSSSSIGNNAGSSSDTSYTISFTTITKGHINNILTDVIQNKKIATIQITTDGAYVVTFWGAWYDDNGFINKVYITDSALGNTLYNQAQYFPQDYYCYN